MIGEVLAKKNKYICLLTSPLCHALQNEIINLIYLFIYVYKRIFSTSGNIITKNRNKLSPELTDILILL